jgi:hypothetical protein
MVVYTRTTEWVIKRKKDWREVEGEGTEKQEVALAMYMDS